MSFITAFRKEFMEQLRTRRFLVAQVVLVLFGIASPLLAKAMPDIFAMIPEAKDIASIIPTPTMADAVTQYLKNLSQFGVILAVLFAMGSIAQEKDKGTASMVLAKPMPRSSFVLAKYAAIAATFSIGITLAAAFGYTYAVILFGDLSAVRWALLNGLLLLYILLYAALTLMFSAISRTQFAAAGLAVAGMVVLGVLGSIPGIGKGFPDALLANAGQLALGTNPENWTGLTVTLGLIVAAITAAWLVFRQQEI